MSGENIASPTFELSGTIVDVVSGQLVPGILVVEKGRVRSIIQRPGSPDGPFLLPGFIDSHVHIESSMLPPAEFARLAVTHGTIATVSDPHEIANVLGLPGVEYMIRQGEASPFSFFFGCPSCVPATGFESAGAALGRKEVESLLSRREILYLSEMMNFPGVLHGDPEVHAKIEAAHRMGKVIDGHAPGLRGEDARRYASFGISTDHECVSLEEAREKLEAGMQIIIREGSAAKNFDALAELLYTDSNKVMFCSDDKHPNDLVEGHINALLRRAVDGGVPMMNALRAATLNPIRHYGLPLGMLQKGDRADFVVVEDLINFEVLETYLAGNRAAVEGTTLLSRMPADCPNNFALTEFDGASLRVAAQPGLLRVIEAFDGQLVTTEKRVAPRIVNDVVEADPSRDLLKLVVVNRYKPAPPAVAFVSNFGLKRGALASSVAHDSHNIIAVGTNDCDIAGAVRAIVAARGGIAHSEDGATTVLPLPIAGLMSAEDGYQVSDQYSQIDRLAKQSGSTLTAPFMTLSFLALLVIPDLKLSDRGLFSGAHFDFVPLLV